MLAGPSLEVCKHAACLRKFALRTPKNGPTCENMHWRPTRERVAKICTPSKSYYPRIVACVCETCSVGAGAARLALGSLCAENPLLRDSLRVSRLSRVCDNFPQVNSYRAVPRTPYPVFIYLCAPAGEPLECLHLAVEREQGIAT